ncbi:hypothetical protein [Rhodococcus erythropolis]|uniref:hypothetical protein n=1 Tax=Rhodococcus erythropolis TaxID=1833 RepID=UPI000AC7335F|nr:hypothetical protein [Rhodococcus erythropolis]
MKVTAWLEETARTVEASNDLQWAMVYKTGRVIYCSDYSNGCRCRLKAVQRSNKSRGTDTRFFAHNGNEGCDHAEVASPVTVPSSPRTKTGPSAEHEWVKHHVRWLAEQAGYVVEEEKAAAGGVIADIWVATATEHRRVEIQCSPDDLDERTMKHPDVLWLLRMALNNKNKKFLFNTPAVHVRIDRPTRDHVNRYDWTPGEPWLDSPDAYDGHSYRIRATGTVLRPCPDPGLKPLTSKNTSRRPEVGLVFFETSPMPLQQFLREVWSGERRWKAKGGVHHHGGWIRTDDLEQYERWRGEWAEECRREAQQQRVRDLAAPETQLKAETPPAVTLGDVTVGVPEVGSHLVQPEMCILPVYPVETPVSAPSPLSREPHSVAAIAPPPKLGQQHARSYVQSRSNWRQRFLGWLRGESP